LDRITIENTLFLIKQQDGVGDCFLDRNRARVQNPPEFLPGHPQTQHTNFLVQIYNRMYSSSHLLVHLLQDPNNHAIYHLASHPIRHMPIPFLPIISLRITNHPLGCPIQALPVDIAVRGDISEVIIKVMEVTSLLPHHT
jgi:hypothetical protein